MVCVVTGGSGSGKSEYAEHLAMTLGEKRIYIATMQALGEEGRQRVARHRNMREGKRFVTVECPAGLERLTEDEECRSLLDGSVALLECMSNLAANEMFSRERNELRTGSGKAAGDAETEVKTDMDGIADNAVQVKNRILAGIQELRRHCSHLVIVTNEVFSDGTEYDSETMEYIGCLGMLNTALAGMADQVTEVVCGIPVKIKS